MREMYFVMVINEFGYTTKQNRDSRVLTVPKKHMRVTASINRSYGHFVPLRQIVWRIYRCIVVDLPDNSRTRHVEAHQFAQFGFLFKSNIFSGLMFNSSSQSRERFSSFGLSSWLLRPMLIFAPLAIAISMNFLFGNFVPA